MGVRTFFVPSWSSAPSRRPPTRLFVGVFPILFLSLFILSRARVQGDACCGGAGPFSELTFPSQALMRNMGSEFVVVSLDPQTATHYHPFYWQFAFTCVSLWGSSKEVSGP